MALSIMALTPLPKFIRELIPRIMSRQSHYGYPPKVILRAFMPPLAYIPLYASLSAAPVLRLSQAINQVSHHICFTGPDPGLVSISIFPGPPAAASNLFWDPRCAAVSLE